LTNSIRALTVWLRLCGFEVPQQPVEGLLIRAMRLPAPEVSDVPRLAYQRWPPCLQGHDRVVDPHWKEDGGALLAFSCQGRFDLSLYPLTRHRSLGQNKKQLVLNADRFIDAYPYFGPYGEIFWGKPAPYTLVLEIRMKAFGKGMVLARVTDEAGVELKGLIEERGQILNQAVWQTTAPEKGEGERPGFGEGAMVEGASPEVLAGL